MGEDDTTWNDNLREGPFYHKTAVFPVFNQFFAALWEPICCSITKMFFFAPDACSIHSDIFNNMIPAVHGNSEADVNAQEKHIVSPGLIGHLKCQWLIYTAAFKDPFAELQGAIHTQFYISWVDTFSSKEEIFSQRLMEQLDIWYTRFPPGRKRGSTSRADNISTVDRRRSAQLEDPKEHYEGAHPGGGGPAHPGQAPGSDGAGGDSCAAGPLINVYV